MKAKYVNPFTDFGFKKLFGEEASKPALLDFLNALLPQARIKTLTFKNNEQSGETADGRKVIFDIYCENELGEKFIVELQKARQNFFKERPIYYSTFPIREQLEKGDWSFNLKAVYCIVILDFTFRDYGNEPDQSKVLHEVKLKNQDGKTFYDKLTYIYLEMPNFVKSEAELESRMDKWLYFIKYLGDFQNIPQIFKNEPIFVAALEKAELLKFNMQECEYYEMSLKTYRDCHNVIETAKSEAEMKGKIQGEKEATIKVANSLKDNSIAKEIITKSTGLPDEEIEGL